MRTLMHDVTHNFKLNPLIGLNCLFWSGSGQMGISGVMEITHSCTGIEQDSLSIDVFWVTCTLLKQFC